jgi:hypothetical protein
MRGCKRRRARTQGGVMRSLRRWQLIPVVAATAVLTAFVASTLADPAATTRTGTEIGSVTVVREPAPTSTSFQGFEDVPGASATLTVPISTRALAIARFATDSNCTNTHSVVGPLYCSVRIMISAGPGGNFVEMEPAPASHFEVFQTHGNSGAQAIERSCGPLRPGRYTVKVQYGLPFVGNVGTPSFGLRFWHLTVERVRATGTGPTRC